MKKLIVFFYILSFTSCFSQHLTRDIKIKKLHITDSVKLANGAWIPAADFGSAGSGGTTDNTKVPLTRTITINGVTHNFTSDVSFSIPVDGSGYTSDQSSISVTSYGAVPYDGIDDGPAIQQAIDYAISNNIRWVTFPLGNFDIYTPLIIIQGGSAEPNAGFVHLSLLGQTHWWQTGYGTQITAHFTNTFALGIQRGKGCIVQGIKFLGQFTPPSKADGFIFFNLTKNTFTDGVCRDEIHSAYSAIVIDPFWSVGDSTTYADHYPNLGRYYGLGGGSSNGSTGVTIQDCVIDKFVIAIANSINGQLRNGELTVIRYVNFGNDYGNKVCVAACQDQEKDNIVEICASWGNTWCFFDQIDYGGAGAAVAGSGDWNTHDINIAGAMVQPLNVNTGGWFSVYVDRWYCESIGKVGQFTSQSGGISNSLFDFESPYSGTFTSGVTDAGFQNYLTGGYPTTFITNCTFRYSNGNSGGLVMPMDFKGIFTNCTFTGLPRFNLGASLHPVFINCSIEGGATFGNVSARLSGQRGLSSIGTPVKYGKYQISSELSADETVRTIELDGVNTTTIYYLGESPHTVNLTGRTFSFTATSTTDMYQLAGLVDIQDGSGHSVGWAQVRSISGSTVTCDYTSNGVVSGTEYYIMPVYQNDWTGAFVGDFHDGNKINNLVISWGNPNNMVGHLFIEPRYKINYPMKITAYDAGLNEFTIASTASIQAATGTGIYFTNQARESYENMSGLAPADANETFPIQKHSRYTIFKNSSLEQVWKSPTSGYNKGTGGVSWVEE